MTSSSTKMPKIKLREITFLCIIINLTISTAEGKIKCCQCTYEEKMVDQCGCLTKPEQKDCRLDNANKKRRCSAVNVNLDGDDGEDVEDDTDKGDEARKRQASQRAESCMMRVGTINETHKFVKRDVNFRYDAKENTPTCLLAKRSPPDTIRIKCYPNDKYLVHETCTCTKDWCNCVPQSRGFRSDGMALTLFLVLAIQIGILSVRIQGDF